VILSHTHVCIELITSTIETQHECTEGVLRWNDLLLPSTSFQSLFVSTTCMPVFHGRRLRCRRWGGINDDSISVGRRLLVGHGGLLIVDGDLESKKGT
jgi:hypothetical protein